MEMDRRKLLKLALFASAANIAGLKQGKAYNDSVKEWLVSFGNVQLFVFAIFFEGLFFGRSIAGSHPFMVVSGNNKVQNFIAAAAFIGYVYLLGNAMILLPNRAAKFEIIKFLIYVHAGRWLQFAGRQKNMKRSKALPHGMSERQIKSKGKRIAKAYQQGNKVLIHAA